MKTWEKVYWVIIGAFFVLSLPPLLGDKEHIIVNIQNELKLFTKGEYFGYLVIGYLIFFVPIWLITRLIVNKGWSEKKEDKERERERERERVIHI